MHYLLIIGAFLFFAFMAPVPVTVAALVSLFVVATIVKVTAQWVAAVDASYGQALKAVGLSFMFLMVAVFTLVSLFQGTGLRNFTGAAGWVVFASFLLAYALGFKLALGTSLVASVVVALVSTIVSTLAFSMAGRVWS